MTINSMDGQGHVAIFTFPFTSHPLVLFNLARKLAGAAPEVEFSFFNTAKSNRAILSTQNIDLPINLKVYNVGAGVPEGFDHSEFRKNPFREYFFFLNNLSGNLKPGMDEAVKVTGRSITCFLTDCTISFGVGKIADELNVPWVGFWILAPYALPAYLQMELISHLYLKAQSEGDHPGDKTVDLIPGLSPIRFSDLPYETKRVGANEPHPAFFLSITQKLQQASALVLNSYEEMNPTLLTNDLKSKFKNLLCVGCPTLSVLPSGLPPSHSSKDNDATGCLSWLDSQNAASVAYISFGTGAFLSREELVALAEALEASGFPFLWSINDNLRKHLPDGFVERTNMLGTGKVVPWAPQTQVLAHNSVGVHVTHCGYNAVFESILGEVPMICRPVWSDNHMNAKMVEEVWEIGVRLEGGVITKSEMLKSLEIIFHHEKGKKLRESIRSCKEVLIKAAGPDGVAAKDFETLVQILLTSKE